MKTFVISLKRSHDRRSTIEEKLNEANITFEFYDAIDASHPNFKYSNRRAPKITKRRFGYHLLDNEVGCFASHIAVWEKCVELNEAILVLEDNISISPELLTNFNALESITEKYKLVKLCALHPQKFKVIESLSNKLDVVRYNRSVCGTQGYTITPDAAKKLLAQSHCIVEPVDNYMEKTWRHHASIYCFKPNLIERADVKSTIGSSRKDKRALKKHQKIYIEVFRLYEQLREKLTTHKY